MPMSCYLLFESIIRTFMQHIIRFLQTIHKLQREDDAFKDFVTREINYFKGQGKRSDLLEKTLHPL